MRRPHLLPALAIVASFFALAHGARATTRVYGAARSPKAVAAGDATVLSLSDFGAVGDGQTDDAPALQQALDALADAGGGTLLVPAGNYVLATPVAKDFGGASVTIQGVESDATVPPPTAGGASLSQGLSLTSEFLPRTGEQQVAVSISGARSLLVKDLAFVGTPGVNNDALVTLYLSGVTDATVRHCEFYGLSSIVGGGAIVMNLRGGLKIEQTEFLGCATNSAVYGAVVQNLEWKSISVTDAVFIDYGQRPELFGKLNLGAPFSWVAIGNAAAPTADAPRREAVVRNVFFDEGALNALSSLPNPAISAPIDLVYVTGLFMNVSNLGTSGHYLSGLQGLLVEDSYYGWSHNADTAINILGASNAILDRVVCDADADTIRADAATGRLSVIDSTYTTLDSKAQVTNVLTPAAPADDPVQYVRTRFEEKLGREPDAAAHYYWSDQLLRCGNGAVCVTSRRAALDTYLASKPQPTFTLEGLAYDDNGKPLAGVAVTLTGSQSATTVTRPDGFCRFENLPTTGTYAVSAGLRHYTFSKPVQTFTMPPADAHADFRATLNRHSIGGRLSDETGKPIAGATVTLSGAQSATTTTDSDGDYSFPDLAAGANYTVTPSSARYDFGGASQTFADLGADANATFAGTSLFYSIGGRVVDADNRPVAGVAVKISGSRSAAATTDAAGGFLFADLPRGGAYTVTPALQFYVFSPASQDFNNLSADGSRDFVVSRALHTVGGRVTEGDKGLGGATVTLSGAQTGTATTDANGNYSFAGLAAGGDYTVTASLRFYAFTPASQTFKALDSDVSAAFSGALVKYRIAGRVTEKGSGLAGVTVALDGTQPLLGQQKAQAVTGADGSYSFDAVAGGDYTVTPSLKNYVFDRASVSFASLGADQTADFAAAPAAIFEFSAASYTAGEGAGSLAVTVTRGGDTSKSVVVTCTGQDGTAQQGKDLDMVARRLVFAPGETTKSFTVFVTDDSFVEGAESLTLKLAPGAGAVAGDQSSATLTVNDNDSDAAAPNPVDDTRFFVRQHYRDFFGREPDDAGLQFWTNNVESCGSDANCRAVKRVDTSAAFFLSIEFQETGYLVYRAYVASYGRMPRRAEEFLLDSRIVGDGLVVGQAGWEQKLEANKQAFLAEFVGRDAFDAQYPRSLTPAQLVAALGANAGGSLSADDVSAAVAEFGSAPDSSDAGARARALRRVVESRGLYDRELNRAFVLMQYFGYLQRNPDDPPQPGLNFDGYNFWLAKLNSFGGNYQQAEMVRAFVESTEYRNRFGK